jgi:hypothetical protein
MLRYGKCSILYALPEIIATWMSRGGTTTRAAQATAPALIECSRCILLKKLKYIAIPKSLDCVMESE